MRSAYRTHAIAAAGLAAAVALRWVLDPYVGDRNPLISLFLGIAIAASVGGWVDALWVTVLGWLIARWMFIEPRASFAMDASEWGRLLAYLLTACVFAAFGETMRRTVRRARDAQQRFSLAADALKEADEAMIRLNAELREADRRKDEFVATLAHELRNPLAPIRNAARILQAKLPNDPELAWGRNVIERQVAHMSRLLEDLLDVSRIAQGKLELRRAPVQLAHAIEGAVETCRPAIDAAGHQLRVVLPDEPLQVEADPVRLAQVFGNLLTNAVKYTERGGRIEIAARREGDEAVVTVADTGIGIAPEMFGRLFQMFAQDSSAQHHSQGGLGIGLSLVKGLVELHGGRVEARSEGPQRGSEFIVHLPLCAAANGDAIMPGDNGAALVRLSRRVLVVDDNRDSADTLSTLLQVMGCEVEVAYDGEQALKAGARLRPDAVLLDLGMPGLNGFETCERIRAEAWGRAICIVAVTGWGKEDDRRRTKEAGFDAHMVKPADPGKLTELLASISVRQPREVI